MQGRKITKKKTLSDPVKEAVKDPSLSDMHSTHARLPLPLLCRRSGAGYGGGVGAAATVSSASASAGGDGDGEMWPP